MLLILPTFAPSSTAAGACRVLSSLGFPHIAYALKIPDLIAFSYHSRLLKGSSVHTAKSSFILHSMWHKLRTEDLENK